MCPCGVCDLHAFINYYFSHVVMGRIEMSRVWCGFFLCILSIVLFCCVRLNGQRDDDGGGIVASRGTVGNQV